MIQGQHRFTRMDNVIYGKPAADAIAEESARQGAEHVFIVGSKSLFENTDEIAKAEQAVFANLAPTSLENLLRDRSLLKQRAHLVDSYWPLARHDVHEPLAMARARAERVKSVEDYVGCLSPKEAMAILNSNADLESVSWRLAPPAKPSRTARGLRLVPLRQLPGEIGARLAGNRTGTDTAS